MFLNFLLFGLSWYYLDGICVQGLMDKVLIKTESMVIAHGYLFAGDVIEVSILNLHFVDLELSRVPLMMISVMKDKTMGYDIDPFFPFMTEKVPVLDLNAANNSRDFILSPSTVIFKIDFPTKTLINDPSSSMINLYPNLGSIVKDSSNVLNGTEQIIKMTSLERNKTLYYNLTFAFLIDTVESEGLYKIYLHSDETVEMESQVSLPLQNVSAILYSVFLLVWLFISSCFGMYLYKVCLRQNYELLHPVVVCGTVSLTIAFFFILITTEWNTTGKPGAITTWYFELQLMYLVTAVNFCLSLWKRRNITSFYHKTDKVFHIFVWLCMIHYSIQNRNTAYPYVGRNHNVWTMNYGLIGVLMNYLIFIGLTADISQTTDYEFTSRVLILGFRKRFWRTRCMFAGYFLIVSFNLVLATMTSLSLPFYFHFVQFAIEYILKMVLLWIGFEYARYREYMNNYPQNMPVAA